MAEKAKILLVDDRAENIVALEAILSSLNQTLVPARSGDAALKALLSDEFAVILLDVLMPGMDGFETAAHIKRRPKTRDVPIIFLTARTPSPTTRSAATRPAPSTTSPSRSTPGCCAPRSRSSSTCTRRTGSSASRRRCCARSWATRWPAAEAARADADPVLAELSARLAAVEDMVTVLSGQTAGGPDPAIAESMRQLEHRVTRLRGVFDALRVDT